MRINRTGFEKDMAHVLGGARVRLRLAASGASSAVEPLEQRRLLSVSAATLFGTTTAGATLTYQVQTVGIDAIYSRTVTIAGPTTFDGKDVVERDTADSEVAGVEQSSDTSAEYEALTDAGVVEYGSRDTASESHDDMTDDTTDTDSPPIVEYPATLVAGTAYTSAWSASRIEKQGFLGTSSNVASTVTGTHTVTLASDTPQPVVVPAGTFQAYELTEVDTESDDATAVTTQVWVAPGLGVVEIAGTAAGQNGYELSAITGATTTPTATTALVPTIAKNTLPPQSVGGVRVGGTVKVAITNDGATITHGTENVAVYATTTGVTNAGETLIGTAHLRAPPKAGHSADVPVQIKRIALPDDTYAIVARVTDVAAGAVADTDAATTMTVAPPTVSLTLAVGVQSPFTVKPGESTAFTLSLQNSGNVDSAGPANIAITLSPIDVVATAITLPTLTRRVRIKASGRTTPVRVRITVPIGTTPGNYGINVNFSQPNGSAYAAGIDALLVT